MNEFSPSTVHGVHAVMNHAINAAVDDEILTRNKISKIIIPKDNNKSFEEKHLNLHEIEELLTYVKKHESFTHFVLILTFVSTGLRKEKRLV